VRNEETVNVRITPDGIPQRVTVDQRLHLQGVGDFFVKIPGPVLRADPLPGSGSQPGLRSGSLVWQGFASDGDVLGARVVLDPERERSRLPLGATVRMRVDGRPVDMEKPIEGSLEMDITLSNQTGTRVLLPRARPRGTAAASALSVVRRTLQRSGSPVPGRGGLPRSIPIGSTGTERSATVRVPLSVTLTVALDGNVRDVKAGGAELRRRGSGLALEASSTLSGSRSRVRFHFEAEVSSTTTDVAIDVEPTVPLTSQARPASSEKASFQRLMQVLSEVARVPEVDAYLGNPDRLGPTDAEYHYEVVAAPLQEAQPKAPPAVKENSLLGIAAALALVLLVLGGLVWLWAVS
jgi:hypothetical protein